MSTNDLLHNRYKAIMAPYLNPLYTSPVSIDRGQGSYVWDVEDNQYLDFFGGVLTTMIGHNNSWVVMADHCCKDTAKEIKVLVIFYIPNIASLASIN